LKAFLIPELLGQFKTDLAQVILGRRDLRGFFFQIKGIVPLQGEVIAKE
jgi:hypothetical protein